MAKRLEYGLQVQIALRGLDPEGERRLEAWFDHLKNADTDPVVRNNSSPLPGHEGVLVWRLPDLRISYRIDGDTVTILQVATVTQMFVSTGISNGGADFPTEIPQATK